MLYIQHFSFDLSILLLAIALIIHTIAEVWILPAYQKVQPDWQSVVLARALFLDNVPILSERSVLLWLVFKSVTSQSFLRLKLSYYKRSSPVYLNEITSVFSTESSRTLFANLIDNQSVN
jgi:hypothetical protein